MPALTADQEAAVARRHGSLLLSAGAGSGKTSVLVERFVRAVREDGIAPSRILAITFTDRAAAELRERVRARLRDLGDRDLARDSERAPIGTVHSFCARILRAHAVAVGLDPGFEVLDEARTADLRERSFVTGLRAFLSVSGQPGVDLLAAYGADRLEDSIIAVHETLRSRGERSPRLPVPEVGGAQAGLAALGRRVVEAAALARREISAADGPLSASAERALGVLAGAEALVAAGDGEATLLPGACAALNLPGGNGLLSGVACGVYREAAEAFTRACANEHARGALRLLEELLERYGSAYARAKHQRGALDFDDLEIEASRLLLRDDSLRRSWAERYELVMIDEFQDTNPRQLAILQALERDNLFTVGDEFQSIYGFRHAAVELFRERRTALSARGATLQLAHNFRGRPEILQTINAVFEPLFGPDFTPLIAGREPPPGEGASAPADEPRVELLITDQRGWDAATADPSGTLPEAAPWRQAEARLLAQRIAELLRDGAATPGGVAVLLRATGDVPVFARALEEQGVPAVVADGAGFWSGQEVLDCLAYLRTLANPLDDVALYGTLASPFVGVSADGLALIARGRDGDRAWDSLQRLFGDASPRDGQSDALRGAFSDADAAALSGFASFLPGERRVASRRSIDAVLRRLVSHTGYDAHLLGLPFPQRRLANLHKLIRLARAYERGEGGGVRGFVDHAERRRAGATREPDAPVADGDSDAVRLMTIHAAKGLEFDVVAVADLGRQGRGDVPDLLVDGERVGLRLLTLDGSASVPTLAFEALREQRLAAEAQEERRILYVAMTRARERLLLSGAINPERWPAPRPTAAPLVWLGPALAEDLAQRLDPDEPVTLLHPPGAPQVTVRCRFNSPDTIGVVLAPGVPAVPGLAPAPASAPAVQSGSPAPSPQSGDPPPPGPGGVSYTALAEFERCGYRYYLQRVLGLPADERAAQPSPGGAPSGELPGRLRGSLVHRLLESFDFRGAAAPPAELVASLAGELGASPSADELDEVMRLVAAVADTELGERLACAPRVWREYPFAFALGRDQPLITGVVDLIAHELGGGCLIVDYKSDRVDGADLAAITERDYGVQREVYGLAALRGGALTVDVVHWYLQRPTEPVAVRYTTEDGDRLAAALGERVAPVIERRYAVSERPHRDLCLTCPGRRALCSHPPSLTLRAAADAEPGGVATQMPGETGPIVARSVFDPPDGVGGGAERS